MRVKELIGLLSNLPPDTLVGSCKKQEAIVCITCVDGLYSVMLDGFDDKNYHFRELTDKEREHFTCDSDAKKISETVVCTKCGGYNERYAKCLNISCPTNKE